MTPECILPVAPIRIDRVDNRALPSFREVDQCRSHEFAVGLVVNYLLQFGREKAMSMLIAVNVNKACSLQLFLHDLQAKILVSHLMAVFGHNLPKPIEYQLV